MTLKHETVEQALNGVIVRCWTDAAFKAQLLADPLTVLREAGVDVPHGIQLRVLEDTDQTVHLVIPARPQALPEEALEAVAGGGKLFTYSGERKPGVPIEFKMPSADWVSLHRPRWHRPR